VWSAHAGWDEEVGFGDGEQLVCRIGAFKGRAAHGSAGSARRGNNRTDRKA
jgi:hypothetical protein